MFERVRHHLIQVVELFDDLDFLFLIVLVLLVRAFASEIPPALHWRQRTAPWAWSLALAYFGYQFISGSTEEPGGLVGVTSRTVIIFALGQGALTLPAVLFNHLHKRLQHRWEQLRRWRRDRRYEADERRRLAEEAARAAALPPEPSRRQRRQQAVADAEEDYRQELELIRRSALKPAERYYVREDAKRRYLKKIQKMLDS